jgi:hypothetical protein
MWAEGVQCAGGGYTQVGHDPLTIEPIQTAHR